MKIIFDTVLKSDNVTSVTASNADTTFPASNLMDDFTTNLWRSVVGSTSGYVQAAVSAGSAVELLNTNATSATITVGTGGTYTLESGSWSNEAGYSLETNSDILSSVVNLPGTAGRLWAEFTNQTTPFIVRIDLVAAAPVYAGILRAGKVQQFKDPAPEFSETTKDFSIEMELNSGANYFRKRNLIRSFSNLTMVESRANAYLFKMGIFDALGPKPVAIKLFESQTDFKYIIFAKRDSLPNIVHLSKDYSGIKFDLIEVV
jgi:hypothetical protein